MVYEPTVRWEHLVAYKAGRLDEIPAAVLDEVRLRVSKMNPAILNEVEAPRVSDVEDESPREKE